jgi:hypothetical protein
MRVNHLNGSMAVYLSARRMRVNHRNGLMAEYVMVAH